MISQTTTTNSMLESALEHGGDYELKIIHVWPATSSDDCSCPKGKDCPSPGKHPIERKWQDNATDDLDEIESIWRQHPNANIGVFCQGSGVVVLDIDPRNGGDETLAKLEAEHGKLPETVTTETGGGGLHFWFKAPKGLERLAGKLGQGIDVKFNGYVLVPPSNHTSGENYRYRDGHGHGDIERAELPQWVLEKAKPSPQPSTTPNLGTNGQGEGIALGNCRRNLRRASSYLKRCNEVPEGGRNNNCFNISGHLKSFGVLERDAIVLMQTHNKEKFQPPLPESEVEQCVRSAYAGNGTPRKPKVEWQQQVEQVVRDLTDTGNAERFAEQHAGQVGYVPKWRRWVAYDSQRGFLRADGSGGEVERAKETMRRIADEVNLTADPKRQGAIVKWGHTSKSERRIAAMLKLARSDPKIVLEHEQLDADPWKLNCPNGTLDLRSGELLPHNPADLITKSTGVKYNADAAPPTLWLEFLARIFEGNQELISYIQRLYGAALVGKQLETIMPILLGDGANGKSVFAATLLHVTGDYGATVPASLLTSGRYDAHPTELAILFRIRLAIASETKDGQQLAENKLKSILGGDKMSARRMREDFWEFSPSHTLALMTNYRPVVRGTDHGIWRRLRLIRFAVTIPPAEQDRELTEKLRGEAEGILRWLVEGLQQYLVGGIQEPDDVRLATDEYRIESDGVAQWLGECCEEGEDCEYKCKQAYDSYRSFCDDRNEPAASNRTFSRDMARRFRKSERRRDGFFWIGVKRR